MKRILASLLFILLSGQAFTQQPGSLDYLDFKNGYKQIMFGANVDTIKNLKALSDGPTSDGTVLYDLTDPSAFTIGSIKLDAVSIRAFKGKVFAIYLFPPKDRGFDLYQVFREAYGMYSEKPNQFMDKYVWTGKAVDLNYNFDSSSRMPLASITHLLTRKLVAEDRKDKSQKSVSDL